MFRRMAPVLVFAGITLALLLAACQTQAAAPPPLDVGREGTLVVGTVSPNPDELGKSSACTNRLRTTWRANWANMVSHAGK